MELEIPVGEKKTEWGQGWKDKIEEDPGMSGVACLQKNAAEHRLLRDS